MTTLTEAGLSLAAGALTTLSPCVFPLLLLVNPDIKAKTLAELIELARGGNLNYASAGKACWWAWPAMPSAWTRAMCVWPAPGCSSPLAW